MKKWGEEEGRRRGEVARKQKGEGRNKTERE